MKRLFKMNPLLSFEIIILVFLSLFASEIFGFEESLFADEYIYGGTLQPPPPHAGLTVPGTKWCGPGRTALSYDDLGRHRETDMCCRDHDHCSEILKARSSKHGLYNGNLLPILKCSCEQKFINCLKSVNNKVSNTLGRIYYFAKRYCFDEGHPIISCVQYQQGIVRQRCIRYKVDSTQPKTWQFYDMPFYKNWEEI